MISEFQLAGWLSRQSIAKGLAVLEQRAMIARPGTSGDYAWLSLTGRQFANCPERRCFCPPRRVSLLSCGSTGAAAMSLMR
jgi:hypothetical protein